MSIFWPFPVRNGRWMWATLAAMTALAPVSTVLGQALKPGQPAPAWQLKDLEGKLVKSSDYRGKVVILDFWATWCPPCRAEIPSFVELQKQYGKDGLVVLGVSLDKEGPAAVKKFMTKTPMNYGIVMADDKIAEAYGGIEAIPTTFIIDRQGKIVAKHVGLTDKSEFEKEIKPHLKTGT